MKARAARLEEPSRAIRDTAGPPVMLPEADGMPRGPQGPPFDGYFPYKQRHHRAPPPRRLRSSLHDDAVADSGEAAAPRRPGRDSPTMAGRRAPTRCHTVDQPAAPSHPPAILLAPKMPMRLERLSCVSTVDLCASGTIMPHECCHRTHCASLPRYTAGGARIHCESTCAVCVCECVCEDYSFVL